MFKQKGKQAQEKQLLPAASSIISDNSAFGAPSLFVPGLTLPVTRKALDFGLSQSLGPTEGLVEVASEQTRSQEQTLVTSAELSEVVQPAEEVVSPVEAEMPDFLAWSPAVPAKDPFEQEVSFDLSTFEASSEIASVDDEMIHRTEVLAEEFPPNSLVNAFLQEMPSPVIGAEELQEEAPSEQLQAENNCLLPEVTAEESFDQFDPKGLHEVHQENLEASQLYESIPEPLNSWALEAPVEESSDEFGELAPEKIEALFHQSLAEAEPETSVIAEPAFEQAPALVAEQTELEKTQLLQQELTDDFWSHYSPGFEDLGEFTTTQSVHAPISPELSGQFMDTLGQALYPESEKEVNRSQPLLESTSVEIYEPSFSVDGGLESFSEEPPQALAWGLNAEQLDAYEATQWEEYPYFSLEADFPEEDALGALAPVEEETGYQKVPGKPLETLYYTDSIQESIQDWPSTLDFSVMETPVSVPTMVPAREKNDSFSKTEDSLAPTPYEEQPKIENSPSLEIDTLNLQDLDVQAVFPLITGKSLFLAKLADQFALLGQYDDKVQVLKSFDINPLEEEATFSLSKGVQIDGQQVFTLHLGPWRFLVIANEAKQCFDLEQLP